MPEETQVEEVAVEGGHDVLLPPMVGWGLVLLSWLIPGAGFVAVGRYVRGLTLFFLIQTCFLIGVLLKGSVLPPAWSPNDWGFNIVNSLTFVTQMGNGFLSSLWLLGARAEKAFFLGAEWHAYFDLATFYIMVSGAMNYFSVSNFYDRHVAKPVDAKEQQ